MAINQIGFPTPQAFSGGADFSPLANLGNVYRQGEQNRLADLAFSQMGTDPAANAQLLIKSGHPDLVPLGVKMQQALEMQKEHQREFGITSGLEERRVKVAEQQQEEADPTYQRQQRVKDLDEQAATGLVPKDWRTQPEWQRYAISGKDMPSRVGLGQPSYVLGPDKKYHEFRPTTSGETVETQYPPGYEVQPPEEVARRRAEGQQLGKATALAAARLPALQDQAETNINAIQELIDNKEGREAATGTFRGRLDPSDWKQALILGEKGVDFVNKFKQVAGGQAYLSGIESFRSLGHLSNQEGDAAKAAYNRMNRATSPAEFESAARDAQRIYKQGLERTQRAAKNDFSTHPLELIPPGYEPTKSTTSTGTPTSPSDPVEAEMRKRGLLK